MLSGAPSRGYPDEHLVIGDYLVTRRVVENADAVYRQLIPGLRPHRKLGRRHRSEASERNSHMFTIESTANSFFAQPLIEISPELFHILLAEDESKSVEERCEERGIKDANTLAALSRELVDLWGQRAITLTPNEARTASL